MRLKKRLLRTLIVEIVVDVDEEQGRVHAMIHWAGGCHTRLEVRRNRTGSHRHCTDQQVVDLVRELAKVAPDAHIAAILNRLGLRTGAGHSWTEVRVRSLRQYRHIPAYSARQRSWLTLEQAARALGISSTAARRLARRGILRGHQVVPCAPWVITQEALQEEGVQAAVQGIRRKDRRRPPPDDPRQADLDLTSFS
ncbi:MAG: helix-turn-helix domain-containing protein [Firmicutes bacterium]|nr:helix-turn-helix domain-containing protein [Bacillota bacterium]